MLLEAFVAIPDTPGPLWLANESMAFSTMIAVVLENLKDEGVICFESINFDRWFVEKLMQSSTWAVDSDERDEKKPLNKLPISDGLLAVKLPLVIEEG